MADTPTTITVDLTVIRPGDTVLVRVPPAVPAARARDIAEQLRQRLAGVADVLVIAGADGTDVYRPDATTAQPDRCCGCAGALCCSHGEAACSTS